MCPSETPDKVRMKGVDGLFETDIKATNTLLSYSSCQLPIAMVTVSENCFKIICNAVVGFLIKMVCNLH